MKITKWINFSDESYIDPFEERLKLRNPNYHLFPPKEIRDDVEEYKKWHEKMQKIPMFLDMEKVEGYEKIYQEMKDELVKHCKETGIIFNSNYHQGGEFGCPVFDDKYILKCTLREWGGLMAEVNDNNDEMSYVKYYLDYGELPHKYPNEVY